MAESLARYELVPSPDREEGALTLKNLSNELEPVVDWHTMGIKLGVEDHKLREIEEQYHDPQRRKHEVLSRWLCKGQNCTWRRVVEVLMQMGEMVVADTIRLKYLTFTTGPQSASVSANPVVVAVAQKNLIVICGKWGELVAHTDKVLQDKLDNREMTIIQFRHILGNLYSFEGKMDGNQFLRKLLKPSASISEMLETLTVESKWGFLNYYPLEYIIEKFGNDSTRKMMKRYKQDLTGYRLMTKIKEHLDAVDLEHPTRRTLPIPRKKLYIELSCKLKVKVTSHSLKYVRDVWRSLAVQFSLPMVAFLLHKIAKGCLEITWHIPSELAAFIIHKAEQSDDYFKEQHFFRVSVDGKHVYTESEVEVGAKVKGKTDTPPPIIIPPPLPSYSYIPRSSYPRSSTQSTQSYSIESSSLSMDPWKPKDPQKPKDPHKPKLPDDGAPRREFEVHQLQPSPSQCREELSHERETSPHHRKK